MLLAVPALLFAAEPEAEQMERLARRGFDTAIIGAFLRSAEPGVLTAFSAAPASRVSNLRLSFRLRRDEGLAAEYLIVNRTGRAIDVSLSGFVDYRRVRLRLGERDGPVHRLHLEPGEWITRPLFLKALDPGGHDFLVLGVVSDSAGRGSHDFSYPLLFHRANIFVDGERLPAVSCPAADLAAPASDAKSLRIRLDNSYGSPISVMTLWVPRHEQRSRADADLQAQTRCLTLPPRSTREGILELPSGWAPDEVLTIAVESPFTRLEPQAGVIAQIPSSVRILRGAR